MLQRPRRLRVNSAMRAMAQETHLQPANFIVPLFVLEGDGINSEISSMPGYFGCTVELLKEEVVELELWVAVCYTQMRLQSN